MKLLIGSGLQAENGRKRAPALVSCQKFALKCYREFWLDAWRRVRHQKPENALNH